MESINEVIESNTKFYKVAMLGKKITQWYKDHGYVKTNFGWLKKDWISKGIELGALGKYPLQHEDGSYTYSAGVEQADKKAQIFHTQHDNWLKFIETKREVEEKIEFPEDLRVEIRDVWNH